ncbi:MULTISPECIES: DNA-directed RNA polymerase subunit alpha C-terminal domain-containing protein [unclassified Nostoc]|uniref:DNA-directed RNA polymerase subunit alpha C-terminal domain-containing protein n=1 Tax=unclassified Nostoc TaxID=2593658 RepID=UPI000CF33E62|nr:DNA-directed RNA polymerase subunit alpha C-terminal domain-containing protein [Nostoc sp. 'Peltigera membranacea cyanobiont' N6]AVH63081.1 DNA-directed RNA polymerase subunit alpha [Nostoc sp. 'Peltigera membranacea cyanobiont' N6]
MGAEGWKIVHFQSVLIDIHETYTVGDFNDQRNYYHNHIIEKCGHSYPNHNNKYFYKKSYILERKITPVFNQTILNYHSKTSNILYKSPIINKTREEALEEYEHDTFFKEELNLSARAYVCLKIAGLVSREDLENLGYSSKSRIMEIANMEQDVAKEIMQWIENNFGIEIAEED